MDKGLKPIPALYACYLLRSTVRHASLYVGSTPHPPRRLKQHNGDSKGGAAKTSKHSLRPWDMTCLVTGFPSKIAALQFEWAWQNTHLTRHVSPNSRISKTRVSVRFSPKTGRARRRGAKPRLSLTDRLANLHLLLQASSFRRWPLRVIFYAEDVYRVWLSWASQHSDGLDAHIDVRLDDSILQTQSDGGAGTGQMNENPAKGIHTLQTDYRGLRVQLEKTQRMLEQDRHLSCAVCDADLPSHGKGVLFCSNTCCATTAHLACFSRHFLNSDSQSDALIPILGKCPGCKTELRWVDLVQELTLRMRGTGEVHKVLKPTGTRKRRYPDTTIEMDTTEAEVLGNTGDSDGVGLIEDDLWHEMSDSSDDASQVNVSRDTSLGVPKETTVKQSSVKTQEWQAVIQESDWEGAETIT